MAGENKREWMERLDPVVDLGLAGLGLLTLMLFANQLLLLLHQFFPVVRVGLLTLLSGFALLVGMAGRKMRRGQHDLPRLIRLVEFLVVGGIAAGLTFYYPIAALILSILVILLMEQLGYEFAHGSEDLLFDFSGLKGKANWEKQWETEGFRLYDRHISGYKKLQHMMLGLLLVVVVVWLIMQKPGFWALIGGGLLFFCQFILLAVGFYQKKRIFWAIHGYEVGGQVFQRMIGLILILAIGFSTLAVVLPVNYNPIPWKAVGNLINLLFNGKVQDRQFNLPEGNESVEDNPEQVKEQNMQMQMGPSWHVWLFITLSGVVVLFFVVAFLGYLISLVGDERYRMQGLSALLYRMYRYFREMLAAWWNGMHNSFHQMRESLVQRREERARQKLAKLLSSDSEAAKLNWLPQNPREDIVKSFAEVMVFLAGKGIRKSANETLSEYVATVVAAVPAVKREIGAMRGLVEEALYSLHSLDIEDAERMRGLVTTLQQHFEGATS